MKDNRIYERFKVHLPVEFTGALDEPGTRMFLEDISAQGARLLSTERFHLQDYVSLEVPLSPETNPVALHGKVVWMKAVEPNALWNVGLDFEGVHFVKLHRLYQFSLEEKF